MTQTITLKDKRQLTPDVHAYTFTRPDGLTFTPGHATEMTLNRDGWKEEGRPFTFTSRPEEDHLQFVIKSYPSHDGVTEQLADLAPGETVDIAEPFGALEDKAPDAPATFLAAGAGLTPFLAILRERAAQGTLQGCQLIFTNSTEADIILRDELTAMEGLTTHFTVTDGPAKTVEKAKVDRAFLADKIHDYSGHFYICGPQGFVDDIRDALNALGADPDRIHTEEGW